MQRIHKIIYKSKKQKKSVAMALVARYCRKTSQLQSVQGVWNARNPQKCLYIGVQEKDKVLPWQNLLPRSAEKVMSSNPCRGLECKEPTKKIFKTKKHEKVLPSTHNLKNNTELDWANSAPTYPQTGHHSRHRF